MFLRDHIGLSEIFIEILTGGVMKRWECSDSHKKEYSSTPSHVRALYRGAIPSYTPFSFLKSNIIDLNGGTETNIKNYDS